MSKTYDIPEVRIEVSGGVAEVVQLPPGIRAVIHDYDAEAVTPDYEPGVYYAAEEEKETDDS